MRLKAPVGSLVCTHQVADIARPRKSLLPQEDSPIPKPATNRTRPLRRVVEGVSFKQ
ncbi:Uncharacterised protein [Mycobacteroides abscessus subsp. abscessus]|nr:Uncharacterised protein [Mycobacteroides abscessus subsp. abscessus]